MVGAQEVQGVAGRGQGGILEDEDEQVLEVEVVALFIERQEPGHGLALHVDDLVGLGEREALLAGFGETVVLGVVSQLERRELFLDFLIQKWNWPGPFLSSVRLVPWGM